MIIYGALGAGAAQKALTPSDPGYVTQRFPANQGQFQVRYVGRRATTPSLTDDAVDGSHFGTSRTYNIAGGKILTEVVGTPIEISVYKVGDKYLGARSNEFGYANYEIIPTVAELNPLGPLRVESLRPLCASRLQFCCSDFALRAYAAPPEDPADPPPHGTPTICGGSRSLGRAGRPARRLRVRASSSRV
jgi:hypothetical protein